MLEFRMKKIEIVTLIVLKIFVRDSRLIFVCDSLFIIVIFYRLIFNFITCILCNSFFFLFRVSYVYNFFITFQFLLHYCFYYHASLFSPLLYFLRA